MTKSSYGVATLALVSVVAAACTAEVADPSRAGTPPTVQPVEVWTIGSADDPAELLTAPNRIRFGPSGEVLIGQPDDRQIRVVNAAGALVGFVGSPGEGPGEIGSLEDFGVVDSRVWVHDPANRRVSWYRLDGTLLGDSVLLPVVIRENGRALVYGRTAFNPGPSGTGFSLPTVSVAPDGAKSSMSLPIRSLNMDGTVGDTLLVGSIALEEDVPAGMLPIDPSRGHYVVSADGTLLIWAERLVAPGATGQFRLGGKTLAGDTVFLRDFSYTPIATDERAVVEQFLADRGEAFRTRWEGNLYVPPSLPPVRQLVAATSGAVWIERPSSAEESVWWVVDSQTGAHEQTVSFPFRVRVHDQVGELVVTSHDDDFGIPYVSVFRVSSLD